MKAIGYYNEYYYRVEIDGQEKYLAGNNSLDSSPIQTLSLDNPVVADLATMREFCEDTTKAIAKKYNADFIGVEYEIYED